MTIYFLYYDKSDIIKQIFLVLIMNLLQEIVIAWGEKDYIILLINLLVHFLICLVIFFRIALGNISNNASVDQIKSIKIYLHEPGKFLFFSEQDKMPNNVKIDPLKLQLSKEASYVVIHVISPNYFQKGCCKHFYFEVNRK